MRLGIISDTHGMLRPEVFAAFRNVDHILHAGDIGSPDILTELETLAPVLAVYGNTDGFDIRGRLPQVIETELEGFRIAMTHGDQFGSPTPQDLNRQFPAAEILIYGHTHRPMVEIVDVVVTAMNPGSAGPERFGLPATVGIMDMESGIPPAAKLVPL